MAQTTRTTTRPSTKPTSAKGSMRTTRHDLDEDTRKSMVTLLNHRLADGSDLYSQTKHAHWNVRGMEFYQLHLLFDEMAETVEGHLDTLAERATALGGMAMGTLRMASQGSSLPEMPAKTQAGHDFVEALADRYAHHAKKLREGIDTADEAGDMVTSDLLTSIATDIDKGLYLLESHLEGPSRR